MAGDPSPLPLRVPCPTPGPTHLLPPPLPPPPPLPAACLQGHFPEPDKDPVIQIASLVTEFGQTAPAVRNIMTLKSCAPITGAGENRGCMCGSEVGEGRWPM